MAMFDDPKKELEKLEQQLLQEEDWLEKELAAARELIGDEPAKKPARKRSTEEIRQKAEKVVIPPTGDVDLDAPKQPKKKKKNGKKKKARKSNKGLIILAVCETLGILGVVAYWLVMIL